MFWLLNLLLLCLGVGIGLILLVFIVLIGLIRHHATKLMFGLPWLTWLTLDEAIAMGHSRFWCKGLLPVFYKDGYLEVRIHKFEVTHLECLSEETNKIIEETLTHFNEAMDGANIPFDYRTVEMHEFRLVKRGGRRRKFKFKALFDFLPGWQPAHA